MRRILNLPLLLKGCVLLAGITAARGQVGIGLSPMHLESAATPGSIQSGPLTISNESASPIRVRAELLDFYIDDQGTPQFATSYPQETAGSCRTWLSLNPMEAEIPAKGSILVRYSLRIPASATPRDYHCAAGFTTLPSADQLGGNSIKTTVRMVAAFYATVGHPPIQGGLTKMALQRVAKSDKEEWQAVVAFENSGLKYFRANGELSILDADGTVVEKVPFPSLPILPERTQQFLIPLTQSYHSQQYTMRARVDIGAAEVQEALANISLAEQ